MQRELALNNPECVLFWLDEREAVAATAHLIAWSRHRGARPYRVAVAYHMPADIEPVLRAAGAHSFLPMDGQSGSLVAAALEQLLKESVRTLTTNATNSSFTPTAAEQVQTLDMPTEPARPP